MERSIAAIILVASASIAAGVQHRATMPHVGTETIAGTMERFVFYRQSFVSRLPMLLPPPSATLFTRESSGDRASTVSFDDAGFDQIVQLHSRAEMIVFMRKALEHEGLLVKNDGMLENIARYYDGECMKQNYSTLIAEGTAATGAYKCHDAWTEWSTAVAQSNETNLTEQEIAGKKMMETHTHGWNLHQDESQVVVATHEDYAAAAKNESEDALRDFVKGVVAKSGGLILDEDTLGGLVSNYRGKPWESAYTRLLHEVRAIGDLPEGKAWIRYGGGFAPLTNDGYNVVATGHVQGDMQKFVLRTIASQGLKVMHEGGLNGFLPWYNGMCSTQSYDALVKELRAAATAPTECGGGWVEPIS